MILKREDEKKKKKKKESKSMWAWKFSFEAKPKFFKFNFKATNIFASTSSKITPFPINLTLTLTKSNTHNSKSFKSKFLGFFRKFRIRSAKGESADVNEIVDNVYRLPRFSSNRAKFVAYEEPNYVVSIVIAFIGLLSQSISRKDQKGIILFSSMILLLFAVIFVISLQRGKPFTDRSIFHSLKLAFF